MIYYTIFDLNPCYDIDVTELKKKYLKAQHKYHPDQSELDDKVDHIEKSMLVNLAYKTLSDDYKRAIYLLKCFGSDVESDGFRRDLSSKELEQIWEDNEYLERVNDLNALKEMEKTKLNEKKLLVLAISKAFQRKDFENALELTIKLKYLTNLVKNISLKIQNANN